MLISVRRPELVVLVLLAGCRTAPTTADDLRHPDSESRATTRDAADANPSAWIDEAESALEAGEPAHAATLFARYLGHSVEGDPARAAYRGLALAHEQLGDYDAAIRAYD